MIIAVLCAAPPRSLDLLASVFRLITLRSRGRQTQLTLSIAPTIAASITVDWPLYWHLQATTLVVRYFGSFTSPADSTTNSDRKLAINQTYLLQALALLPSSAASWTWSCCSDFARQVLRYYYYQRRQLLSWSLIPITWALQTLEGSARVTLELDWCSEARLRRLIQCLAASFAVQMMVLAELIVANRIRRMLAFTTIFLS